MSRNILPYVSPQASSNIIPAQWQNEAKNDWTMEVKKNLIEFGIPQDFEFLKSKSSYAFQNLVKKKGREFEFKRLLKVKITKAKSK